MRVVRAITITSFWLLASLPLEGATLTWDPNPEPDVLGYMVSYGTQPGVHTTQVDVGKVVVFSLTPPAGQTYYVVVQAFANAADIIPKSDELVLSPRRLAWFRVGAASRPGLWGRKSPQPVRGPPPQPRRSLNRLLILL